MKFTLIESTNNIFNRQEERLLLRMLQKYNLSPVKSNMNDKFWRLLFTNSTITDDIKNTLTRYLNNLAIRKHKKLKCDFSTQPDGSIVLSIYTL